MWNWVWTLDQCWTGIWFYIKYALVPVFKISESKNRKFMLLHKPQKAFKESSKKATFWAVMWLSSNFVRALVIYENRILDICWELWLWTLRAAMTPNGSLVQILNTRPTPICTYKYAHDMRMFKSVVKRRLPLIGPQVLSSYIVEFFICMSGEAWIN